MSEERKTGRPKAEIDYGVAEELAAIGATLDEMAAVLGAVKSTIKDRMASDPEFAERIERGRARGQTTLRRHQWQQAEAGNPTMLIWLGKQLLGQRDMTSAARRVTLGLPPIQTPADVGAALSELVGAMGRGEITPDEAATIAGVLEQKRKSIETIEHEARLSALEQQRTGRHGE